MLSKTIVTAILVLALAGCQTMTGRTAGRNVDDATISASVKTRLIAEKASNLTRIDVETTNGVVSLNGVVQSSQQKAHAEDLARHVDGVRGVNNNLQISSN